MSRFFTKSCYRMTLARMRHKPKRRRMGRMLIVWGGAS